MAGGYSISAALSPVSSGLRRGQKPEFTRCCAGRDAPVVVKSVRDLKS